MLGCERFDQIDGNPQVAIPEVHAVTRRYHRHAYARELRVWRKRLYSVLVCWCGKVDETSWREEATAAEMR